MPDGVTLNQWVPKGWGGEVIVVNTPEYCGKRLLVLAGRRCSVHKHRVKTETFCVQSGQLWVDIHEGDAITQHHLSPGDALHIPAHTVHQFWAPDGDVWVIEFSSHDDPADSVKLERGDVLPEQRAGEYVYAEGDVAFMMASQPKMNDTIIPLPGDE